MHLIKSYDSRHIVLTNVLIPNQPRTISTDHVRLRTSHLPNSSNTTHIHPHTHHILFTNITLTPSPYVPLSSPSQVRCGACMAVGISCAGTANKEALDLLTPMLEDQVDFVRQGALVSAAYCLLLYMNRPFQYFSSPSYLHYFLISHTPPSITSYLNPTTSSSPSFSPSFTSSFFLLDFPRSGDAANSRGAQSIREEVPRPPHCRHR